MQAFGDKHNVRGAASPCPCCWSWAPPPGSAACWTTRKTFYWCAVWQVRQVRQVGQVGQVGHVEQVGQTRPILSASEGAAGLPTFTLGLGLLNVKFHTITFGEP